MYVGGWKSKWKLTNVLFREKGWERDVIRREAGLIG